MAKIATITNPLTGQPAQVDQLDHTAQQIDDAIARALPGGAIDIDLANKAPAGFGLGGGYQLISDANSITIDGKYATDDSTLNLPVNGIFGVLEVSVFRPDKSITQLFRPGTNGLQPYSLERHCINGTWSEWAWVNPPMTLGVEYRTTEMIDGKPVYKKLAKLGNLPNNTTEDFPFTADTNARCFEVCAQVGYFEYAEGWRFTLPSGNYLAPVGLDNKIRITVNRAVDNSTADHPVTAIVKYYKTTD